MRKASALGTIEKEIERLSTRDQLKLMGKLAQHSRRSGIAARKGLDWTSPYRLGKGLWDAEDAQKYVDRLRDDRV